MDAFSRYRFSEGLHDAEGNLYLTEPLAFRYQAFSDNREHVVCVGDTLWSLAAKYFEGIPNPERLFWVIADFQPEPIVDPTLVLSPGRKLLIPSLRVLSDEIFHEKRRSL